MLEDAPESPDDALACQALLYASGELDVEEAAAFEQLLGEDQAAREALWQAVQFNLTASGQAPAVPDPAYRTRVRQRLQQRRRHLRKLAAAPSFFGHPAMWCALGAAAAVLMMVVLHHLSSLHDKGMQTKPKTTQSTTGDPASKLTAAPVTPELARNWAELHNTRHLDKVSAEERRRKLRASGAPGVDR
jgi:anti-sigma-K factor RskA